MKVIICGTRTTDELAVDLAIQASGFDVTEVVCGDAKGVDTLGAAWAEAKGIPVRHFPADWRRLGRSAGFQRNKQMGDYAEAVVAVWDGASNGTAHMIRYARARGLAVYVFEVGGPRGLFD